MTAIPVSNEPQRGVPVHTGRSAERTRAHTHTPNTQHRTASRARLPTASIDERPKRDANGRKRASQTGKDEDAEPISADRRERGEHEAMACEEQWDGRG